MKKLAGTLFVYNGESQDYCYLQAIQCLLDFCDAVYVVDAGSTDSTVQKILTTQLDNREKLILVPLETEHWNGQHGKEKLNYFTNIAIDWAEKDGYEWQFNLQADEIVHESSYQWIRLAVGSCASSAYMCSRINLWASPYLQLNVPQERKPCSTEIVRLATTNYRSYGDAESLQVDKVSTEYLPHIRIYHMGFVRKREIHPAKIRHMQGEVFKVGIDSKLNGMEIFDPYAWFSPQDLKLIEEPLPKLIQPWAEDRTYNDLKHI